MFAFADTWCVSNKNVHELDQKVSVCERMPYIRKPNAFSTFTHIAFKKIIQICAQFLTISIIGKLSKHTQNNTKIAFNKYYTRPCVSLSGDRLTTGGDGHTERDGKLERRAVVCLSQWGLC